MQQQQQQAAAAAAAQQQQQAQTQQRAGQAGLKGDGGAAFDPASAANADREDDASGARQRFGISLISSDWTIWNETCPVTLNGCLVFDVLPIYRLRVDAFCFAGSLVDSVAYVVDWTAA